MLYGICYTNINVTNQPFDSCILITDNRATAEQFCEVIHHGNGFNLPAGDEGRPVKYSWKLGYCLYVPQQVRIIEIETPISAVPLGQALYLNRKTYEISIEERPCISGIFTTAPWAKIIPNVVYWNTILM